MEIFVQSNEWIRKMFDSRYNVSETISNNTDIVVIVRSNEQDPEIMNDIIRQTDGMIPLFVLIGTEDQIGKSYEETAIFSGQIIERTNDNIVIQNGEDQKQTYYINEHTKVQVGVVSDRSLDMIVLGANANILAYNGVVKVIHVKY
ncbi:hypothetical protein [Chengkuizengella marina]|uniref:Uncharacterized protein n=1 Tax=Chengkuizengella marina TaxID=2507566 RepID=A0A6N9Q1T6_9BACL|nr:hypothetical protein [Chengkuizengella marina]NBI28124.1 hypothetical protein [Chengkuizengella marina]